jgi:hypothetical protein
VGVAVDGAVRDAVGGAWHKYNGGALWPGWCAWRLFFVEEVALTLGPELAALASTWRDLSTGAGWWWPHRDFCIVAPRHETIYRDADGRLHSATGPALSYPDGWAIYSWHGTTVPREWIEHPELLTAATALNHHNVEQRRAAAEIVGWDRVLAALPHRVVDEDRDPLVGTLLSVDLPDAPGSQFLRVRCGTGRDFVLPCVNNEFRTALAANAASWGDDGVDPELIRNLQVRT